MGNCYKRRLFSALHDNCQLSVLGSDIHKLGVLVLPVSLHHPYAAAWNQRQPVKLEGDVLFLFFLVDILPFVGDVVLL